MYVYKHYYVENFYKINKFCRHLNLLLLIHGFYRVIEKSRYLKFCFNTRALITIAEKQVELFLLCFSIVTFQIQA